MTSIKLGIRILLLTIVVVAGCYHDYDYQYISLIRSMDVLDYGPPEIINIREHSDMPISYVREGNRYTLFATIDSNANKPTVIFSGVGVNGENISIEAAGIYCYLFIFEIRSKEFELFDYPAGGVRLNWDDRASPECETVSAPTEDERKITITVFDDDGRAIGEEEIYFDIVKNGIKREYESI